MTYRHPLAFLLGLEGIALLRAFAGDGDRFDRAFVEARLAEVRTLLANEAELGEPATIGRASTVDGYRGWSATYDEPGNALIAVEEPFVRTILETLPVGSVFDAACGTGRHTRWLSDRGHRVVGVDSSPDMLAYARARVPEATFALGDLTALPLPDASVDLVVCGLALAHVPDLTPVLTEFARVLRPGGHIVTSDIHVASLYLGGVAKATVDGAVAFLPFSRFWPSDYLRAAGAAGLRVRACWEPRWPSTETAGGPNAAHWCPAAADAAYTATPAAIIWHFQPDHGGNSG